MPHQQEPLSFVTRHTIAILVKETEGFLEFGNLFFGKLVRHGCCCCWLLLGIEMEGTCSLGKCK